ncbi:hypothetical protein GGS20DRAFT_471659 [Poronia punctata]|nr:hypothetical protein GGS20DRAFT_471659 [Poronia punctata]
MCLIIDYKMCSKSSSSKSKSSSSSSSSKSCRECKMRKITRDEVRHMMSNLHVSSPPAPPPPPALVYATTYGYGAPSSSRDGDHYPVDVTRSHTKTVKAKDAYKKPQEDGKETKSEMKKAAKEKTHDSFKDTHTLAAEVKETRKLVSENNTAQKECAADMARVRQLLEAEAEKRDEARRMREMVRYAQSQGLLSEPRSSSSGSSSRTSSSSRAEEEKRRRQQWEREREQFETFQQAQQAQLAESMREFTTKQQRIQEEHERWKRWQKRENFHYLSPTSMCYDDDTSTTTSSSSSSYSGRGNTSVNGLYYKPRG